MGIDTDLNQSPYYDDFDETKNFHRVLFKPGVAVQARELTQLQTILQNQIERFGNNILVEGTIIQGCNFTEMANIQFVKILDIRADGQPVAMSTYKDMKAVGVTTGVTAYVRLVATGLQTQSPDLNTLFVKYLTTGNNEEKTFSLSENVEIRNPSTDELIATVTVANAVEGSDAIGSAWGTVVDDGIIYQKGHFVRIDRQAIIVSKYSNRPDGVIVGFETTESLINSNNDTSLLDNANGYNNYNAYGADRLKLTSNLVVKTLAEAEADEKFFGIQEYQNGHIVRRNRATQYDGILKVLQERTKDESGNYTVNDFPLSIRPNINANTELLSVMIGKGKAYVEGRSVELVNTFNVDLPKATSYSTESAYTISQNIGHYIQVDNFKGDFQPNIMGQATIYDATGGTGNAIGTCNVRAVVFADGTPGASAAIYNMYIFNIKMNSGKNFSDAASLKNTAGAVTGLADLVSTTIYDASFKRSIFSLPNAAVKSLPASTTLFDYVATAKYNVTINTDGEVDIALTEGEYPYGTGALNSLQKEEIVIVPTTTDAPNYTSGVPLDITAATANVTSTTSMSISGLGSASGSVSAIAYVNVKHEFAQPSHKDLVTAYVTINCASHSATTSGPYSLGFPDVYDIEGIWVGSTYSESNTDRTSDFILVTGQKDAYYGLSKIRKKRAATLTSADRILVKVKVFKENNASPYGKGVFTVNSYPIDDANIANTAAIQTENIPLYTMEDGNTVVDLRNAVDMRPQCSNTAAYSTTIGGATNNPSNTLSFGTANLYTVVPNKDFEADYEYYLARKDLLVIDTKGAFTIISGTPDENPRPPSVPNTGMVLGRIEVGPYPSLDPKLANILRKPYLSTNLIKYDNKRYTMRDIGGIEQRITNLEYYTALNALETSAKDMIITGADGLDRFKNGIFTDNFKDLSGSNVRDINFSASLSSRGKSIGPKEKMIPFDLRYNAVSGVDVYPKSKVATLDETSTVSFIKQPYATNYRNCVTDYHRFTGRIELDPPYDSSFDTTAAPAIDFEVDVASPIIDLVDAINDYVPLTKVETVVQRDVNRVISETQTRVGTRSIEETTSLRVTNGETSENFVGEFVTDVSLSPFIRARRIYIFANGLRPNTKHYVYFDGVDVNEHCGRAASAVIQTGATITYDENDVTQFVRRSKHGVQIRSDADGIVRAYFDIPAETFYNGDRQLQLLDVNSIDNIAAATSTAHATYNAFNFSKTVAEVNMTTRYPEIGSRSTRTAFNDTRIVTTEGEEGDGDVANDFGGYTDPIAQTFTISKEHSTDSVVMLSKMRLFFNKKNTAGKGVTVQIRNTVNGYPGPNVIPFGSVHLKNSQINANDTSASTATTIDFKAPIALKVGHDYCFVVIPDGNDPDFLLWTSKTGGTDVDRGIAVTKDSHNGTLFTSTNNKAWTPYQDENIKFALHKGQYASTGTINLAIRKNEFLDLSAVTGAFKMNEKIGLLLANSVGTVNVSDSSLIVTGDSTNFTHINSGDYIAYYANTSVIDVVRVDSANTTAITLSDYPKYANTSTKYFKTTVGDLAYWDKSSKYVLENSSASSSVAYYYDDSASANTTAYSYFQAGDTVFGETSGATATIDEVVNQNISYIQPNMYKSNTAKTNVKFNAFRLTNTAGNNYASNEYVATNDNMYLNKQATIIKSRSNEVVDGTSSSLVLQATLSSSSVDSTPVLDYGISNISAYEFIVNNDSTDETDAAGEGAAASKYISRTVTLAEGFDADDLKVFVTGYRPPSTDIEVYARFQNIADPREVDNVVWTKLDITGSSNVYSSANKLNDFRELEYTIPAAYNSAIITDGPAALNRDNNEILRYVDNAGTVYDKYRVFTIKVVFKSSSHKIVPRMKDIRAIALT